MLSRFQLRSYNFASYRRHIINDVMQKIYQISPFSIDLFAVLVV